MGDSKKGLTREEAHELFDARMADVVSQIGVAIGRSIATLGQERLNSAEGVRAATDRLAVLAMDYIAEAARHQVLPVIGKALEGVRVGLTGHAVENFGGPDRLKPITEFKR